MRKHLDTSITVVAAVLAVLCTAGALAAADAQLRPRPERAVPATDVEGWHSTRSSARAATPSAMPAAGGELDPALQRLDGVTHHG